MKCPRCQFESTKEMRFCGKCGSPLSVSCPKCGIENPADVRFCGQCGEYLNTGSEVPAYARRSPRDYTPPFLVKRVLKGRGTMEGERKLVSVLFADVVNFTTIAENLDPEDVHDIMDGCFEILGEEIHGAGGTINQYTGDGVMALFGAPIAYEDHISRACHAALQIQNRLKEYDRKMNERYRIPFKMRIGIHTGPVVVGAIGDNLRLDYTAVGDTTNLASRLQSLAPAGEILVSDRVRQAAEGHFLFQDMGRKKIKGKSESVKAFVLAEELTADSLRGKIETIPLLFIDREQEMSLLRHSLEEAKEKGPVLVAVTGEAGIGKTRLLRFFRQSLQDVPILFLEGHCSPYAQAVAFEPFIFMFRAYFKLSEKLPLEEALPEVKRQLKESPLYPQIGKVLDLFRVMREGKSSELVVEGRKRELFNAIRDLLHRVSELRPLVIALDDMQWADASTREFLTFMVESPLKASILLLCTGRSDPGPWCPGLPNRLIRIKPLSAKHSTELFYFVLGTDLLEPRISDEIISNAGGNPLFLVEMGEALRRQELVVCDSVKCTLRLPVRDIKVPDSIHGVLAARLDALQENQKRCLQLAAIIGKDFSLDLLVTLSGRRVETKGLLEKLEKQGIIQRVSSNGGGTYQFRHQMMREVAYSTLLRRERRQYHGLVGISAEKALGKGLRAQVGFLAYHFYEAQDWRKALKYTLEAGEQGKRSYACHEALSNFDRALEIFSRGQLTDQDEKLPEIYERKGGMHFCVGERDAAFLAFKRMYSHAKTVGDKTALVESLFRMGWTSFYLHHPKAARNYLEEAIKMARREELSEILLKAKSFLGFLNAVLGRLKEAKPLLMEAYQVSGSQGGIEGRCWSCAHLIQYYNWIGEFKKALELSEELQRLNDKIRSPHFNIVLHFRLGLIYGALGRMEAAQVTLESGLKQLDARDDRFWRPRFLNTLGWVNAERGDFREALELNEESLKEAIPTGDPETIHNAQINVGENLLQLGNFPKARRILEKTWEEVKKPNVSYTRWRYKTRLLTALGDLYSGLGDRRSSLYFVQKALDLATKSGAKKHLARALLAKGQIIGQSSPHSAFKALEKAMVMAEEMETPLLAERVRKAMGDLK